MVRARLTHESRDSADAKLSGQILALRAFEPQAELKS